ncbi:histidine--tRNA ligase [Patescibacteria group bacterium]|nr:histidine--tRNA ligase [Patescibacteria group bacterium]MBU0879798.1 histidine--tRNA ligase [Patescibacteria group bacterium]MBU0880427.1 histidine--tRNA ligase [Patescibacteria group bacterium]MBU1783281.1 histidine--tRNA ligase [Patescibacteria group bacterium]MBU1991501.1 histidine--tRNA ligase [Patescibacteria group bacterium]
MQRFVKNKGRIEEIKPFKSKNGKVFARLRGMKDVLPDEYRYWSLISKKINELTRAYGFKRIDTPVLENAELYERSTGKTSDIIAKEMFSFIDKNDDKIALRPEGTPGIVRSYVEHGMFNLPQPVKLFWLGQVFRHDKPQAGRFRQFTQIDLECIGEKGPVVDAQLILIAYNFFKELQIDIMIQINSIGCPECRKAYINKLENYYKERGNRTKLCNDCKRRLGKNSLRLLDCKEAQCIAISADAPQIVDYLCDECKNHFIKVLEYLDEVEVPYNLNSHLVRGLDYYTKTVFEIWPIDAEDRNVETSRQLALGGGGRYDGLVEYLGGRPAPACGFGIGVERVVLKIKEKNIPLKDDDQANIFIAQLGDQARRKAMTLFEELRRAGLQVRQDFTKDSLKNQLEVANKLGVKYSLILGQKEIVDGTILIRDMESGIQEIVDYKKIRQEITKRLDNEK